MGYIGGIFDMDLKMNLNESIFSIERQLRNYLGDRKAIVGLSGGIDSTVVAYLCVRALGKDNVIGVEMPYDTQSVEDSALVVKELGIKYIRKNIKTIVSQFPVVDAGIPHWGNDKLISGNIMARVRMTLLYAVASYYKGFVIGTTNKTEAKIGYYTKYGDGGVDLEPIADLYKTEVWEMARILGVPENLITKVPSAGLWDNQTDEGDFGMTYAELDDILKCLGGNTDTYAEDECIRLYGEKNTTKVLEMIGNSEHKRHMPPAFMV